MIKVPLYWEKWERKMQLRQPADLKANLRLLEAMYEEARTLGVMAQPPSLEGLESWLRLARALNARKLAQPMIWSYRPRKGQS